MAKITTEIQRKERRKSEKEQVMIFSFSLSHLLWSLDSFVKPRKSPDSAQSSFINTRFNLKLLFLPSAVDFTFIVMALLYRHNIFRIIIFLQQTMQRKLIPGLVYDYVFQRIKEEWKENHERDKQWKEEMRLLFSDVDSFSLLSWHHQRKREEEKKGFCQRFGGKRKSNEEDTTQNGSGAR